MHDGSTIHLHKVDDSLDPFDRRSAMVALDPIVTFQDSMLLISIRDNLGSVLRKRGFLREAEEKIRENQDVLRGQVHREKEAPSMSRIGSIFHRGYVPVSSAMSRSLSLRTCFTHWASIPRICQSPPVLWMGMQAMGSLCQVLVLDLFHGQL